ncbi:MAG TPA: 3-hydroxyacyl-CoA dehydrogenase family protein [Gemmatimonadales bacterium]|nr:3-hydroxyacyl-CoA dehydrogenase family protein [Gemmatimonadales bacterium]
MTPPRVAVIGAGTMGHGIAYAAALAGCPVVLSDANAAALTAAQGKIEALLAGGVKRGKVSEADAVAIRTRITYEPTLSRALATAECVIEAVVERPEVKRALFAEVAAAAPAGALLATNTSSLSVTDLAAAVRDPSRFLGIHFFNPVHLMKLVEVVTHDRASQDSIDRALAFARLLGKEPIVVRDTPGFASSRLGVVLGLEAMRMLEQGVATAEDIDKAMELGYNHPMGPLKLTDVVGLDVRLAIAEYLHQELKLPHYAPPKILRDKVAKGELGKKSGKGFYAWSD